MRRLNTAVVAGGVVYPVGTAETPGLAEMVPPVAWDGEADMSAPVAPTPESKPELDAEETPEVEQPKPARKRVAKKPAED